MALVSSGNQIALQGTGDTNPSGQTFHLDTTITSASTSCSLIGFTQVSELGDNFYSTETTLSGTIYGFKTAQTTEYSGTARLTRGFDDTNPQVASNSLVKGSGFFDNIDWFGSSPATGFGSWWTTRGVVGVTLGVDENSLGSISTQSYTAGGSVGTLEVHHFGWFDNASSSYPNGTTLNTTAEGNWIMLTLKSTSSSPPDSNDSFYSVIINGQEFLRSDAATISQSSNAAYDSNVSSGTHYYRTWRWDAADVTDSDLSAIGTTGSKTFKLSTGASSTQNTGIAEEFGGADSSNVTFSDYYKGASSGYVNTGTGTTNIPTSGQIAFSDFYGSSYVAPVLTSVEVQPSTIYQLVNGPRGGQYENIMHGFGQASMATYNSTMSISDGYISDTARNGSAQGSIISSPDLTKWGVSSIIGTLSTIVHFSTPFTGTVSNVAMIVTGTGSNSNSGFTTLTATRSGMTTLALNRSDATYYYSSTGTARIWIWSSASAGSSETTLSNYLTGSPSSYTADSTLFPGGDGSSESNTTTTSRTTWTIS